MKATRSWLRFHVEQAAREGPIIFEDWIFPPGPPGYFEEQRHPRLMERVWQSVKRAQAARRAAKPL